MSNKKFDVEMTALEAIRQAGASPESAEALRRALKHRQGYLVAKAARIAAEQGQVSLVSDLLGALDRFYVDPVKTDPKCWAKDALLKALVELGHDDAEPYLRGLRYRQLEPVWGGQEDFAAGVRAASAQALVQCRSLSDETVLSHLVEALVDPDKAVRVSAASAIGRIPQAAAALVLRLRLLMDRDGDDLEVTGACFAALISIQREEAVEFISGFLPRGDDMAIEAAIALGESKLPSAAQALIAHWPKERNPQIRENLLTALALSRQPAATDFLIREVGEDTPYSVAALKSLNALVLPPDLQARVQEVVERTGNPRLGRLVSSD